MSNLESNKPNDLSRTDNQKCPFSGFNCAVGEKIANYECGGAITVFIPEDGIDYTHNDEAGLVRGIKATVSDRTATFCGRWIDQTVQINTLLGHTSNYNFSNGELPKAEEDRLACAIRTFIAQENLEEGDVVCAITGPVDGDKTFVFTPYSEDLI